MSVTAFAPGSVTTVFVPQDGTGSLGVSFATADGVTALVERASAPAVYLDGGRCHLEPVDGVLRRLEASAAVWLETGLPIGCGFGVSGAATLATALAVNAEFQLDRDRDTLVEAAHRAEVAAGTGLGDVFIQNRGGLVWDVGHGIQRTERSDRIGYKTFGDVSTSEVLRNEDAMDRVVSAGRDALASFQPDGSLAALFDVSWTFAEQTGLASDRVVETVEAVHASEGRATMAMIGETVIGTGAAGVLESATRISSKGAHLL